nr:uncharacterized protein LOC110363673 isoform X2 [Columba livia]
MSAAHQPGSCSQTTPDPVSTDKPSLRLAQLECIKSRSGRVILCLQLRAPSQTGAVEAVFTGSPSLVLSVRGGTVLAEAQGVLHILLQLPPALYVGVTRVDSSSSRCCGDCVPGMLSKTRTRSSSSDDQILFLAKDVPSAIPHFTNSAVMSVSITLHAQNPAVNNFCLICGCEGIHCRFGLHGLLLPGHPDISSHHCAAAAGFLLGSCPEKEIPALKYPLLGRRGSVLALILLLLLLLLF